MATIKPFRALRLQDVYVDKMLSQQPGAACGETQAHIAQLLDSGHQGGGVRSNMQISENLKKMLSRGDFYLEDRECLFVYEMTSGNTVQTGIWGVTSLEDFESGHIHAVEARNEQEIAGLLDYREKVRLEGCPVMLMHRPNPKMRLLLQQVRRTEPGSVYYCNRVFHRLWPVYDLGLIRTLKDMFADLQQVSLVRGMQHMAAAQQFRKRQEPSANADFNYISSVYLSSDQLKVQDCYQLLIPPDTADLDVFFRGLKRSFSITKSLRNEPVFPIKYHDFGFYMDGRWYNMTYKLRDNARTPDACLMEEKVFTPLLTGENGLREHHLISVTGPDAAAELVRLLGVYPGALAITQVAAGTEQLTEMARQGVLLPPYAFSIGPKMPFGLLLRQLGGNVLTG